MIKKIFLIAMSLIISVFLFNLTSASGLNCVIVAAGTCSDTSILYLENETGGYNNAHTQNVSEASYNWVICCEADAAGDTVTVSCSDSIFLKLSALSNAHVQQPWVNTYPIDACISAQTGKISCTYGASCSGSDTCLVSMASSEGGNTTNAHVASCDYYNEQVCCSLNNYPDTNSLILNSTSGLNRTAEDLTCYAKLEDADSVSLTAYYKWYKDGVLDSSGSTAASNNTWTLISTLDSSNTQKHEVWICSVLAGDGNLNETEWNNATLTILNTPPTAVSLISLENGAHTTNRTPTFNWSESSDDDGDSLTYQLNITPTCNSAGCNPADSRLKNRTELSYTLDETEKLNNLYESVDHQDYYNWTLLAWDGEDWSDAGDDWRIYINSLVVLSMINDSVNFGTMALLEENDTINDSPLPLLLQNEGNCYVDINMSVSSLLWEKHPTASSYFQCKIDKYSGWNSFNWGGSATSWTNVPIGNSFSIEQLNYTSGNNRNEIDIAVEVPDEEPQGPKSSTLLFTGWYVKDP